MTHNIEYHNASQCLSLPKGNIIKNSNQYNKKKQDCMALEHNSFNPTLHTKYKHTCTHTHTHKVKLKESKN